MNDSKLNSAFEAPNPECPNCASMRELLKLKNDEYIQQIGTWKHIQRLECEIEELREKLKICRRGTE